MRANKVIISFAVTQSHPRQSFFSAPKSISINPDVSYYDVQFVGKQAGWTVKFLL